MLVFKLVRNLSRVYGWLNSWKRLVVRRRLEVGGWVGREIDRYKLRVDS